MLSIGQRTSALIIVLLLVATIGVVSHFVPPSSARRAEPPSPLRAHPPHQLQTAYVGSARCAECHAAVAEQFARHPKSHSIGRAEEWLMENPLTADLVIDPPGPYRYRVSEDQGALVHEEVALNADGEELTTQSRPVAWMIGSGRRGRTFTIETNGVLRESPLTWYANGAKWDLSPGYQTPDQPHFQRRITTACLQCHAGQVATRGANQFDPDHPFLEAGIGCERCHGPGADHVAFHEQADRGERSIDPIVNPSRLDSIRRDAVCNRCHLSGGHRVLHAGVTEVDFVPGRRLADVWTIFVDDMAGDRDDGPGLSQPQQMRESRCYQATNGRLGCISCHDPHEVPEDSQRLGFYRTRCLNCHAIGTACTAPSADRLRRNDACTECHMPRRQTSNLPHTAQSDHRIRRQPGAEPRSSRGGELVVWDEGVPKLDAEVQERARQMLIATGDLPTQDPLDLLKACRNLELISRTNPADGPCWEALARGAMRSQQPQVALTAGQRASEVMSSNDAT